MVEPRQGREVRAARAAADGARRREIARTLAELGLGGPQRWAGGAAPSRFDGGAGHRLRLALERLGPVFSAFGAYLSSRPDLLPLVDCLELRETAEWVEPLASAEALALIEEETGRSADEIFEAWEETPLRSDLTTEIHLAHLRGGAAVLVRLGRGDAVTRVGRDLPHLMLLVGVLPGGRSFPLERTVSDFRAALADRLNLTYQAATLGALAPEAARLGSLRLPRVVLATPRLLGLERLEGEPLADFTSRLPAAAPYRPELGDLARRLCLAWLHQALVGCGVAVEVDPRALLVASDGRVGLAAGVFARLSPPSAANLLAYLIAVAAEDPDRACVHLLREMEAAPSVAAADLRQRLRQLVPFRDGGWGTAGDGRGLAERLFVQWQAAAEFGLRPQPHLVEFYRGLFGVAAAIRPLTPADLDPLLEALQNLRFLTIVEQLGRAMEVDRVRDGIEAYALALAELPESLDEVLSQAAEGRPRRRFDRDSEAPDRRRDSRAAVFALAVALAAIALLTHRLAAAPGFARWAEAAGAILFILVGALLLRTILRQGR